MKMLKNLQHSNALLNLPEAERVSSFAKAMCLRLRETVSELYVWSDLYSRLLLFRPPALLPANPAVWPNNVSVNITGSLLPKLLKLSCCTTDVRLCRTTGAEHKRSDEQCLPSGKGSDSSVSAGFWNAFGLLLHPVTHFSFSSTLHTTYRWS